MSVRIKSIKTFLTLNHYIAKIWVLLQWKKSSHLIQEWNMHRSSVQTIQSSSKLICWWILMWGQQGMYFPWGSVFMIMNWYFSQKLPDYDVFISCLDSHSDGTHSLQRIHWWAIWAWAKFLQICSVVEKVTYTWQQFVFACFVWWNNQIKSHIKSYLSVL